MTLPANRNTVLGAGTLYFDRLIGARKKGELYLANTESLELAVASAGNVKDYDADGEIATLNLDIDTQVDRSLTFVTKHISDEAIALFFGGTAAAAGPAAAAFTAQPINGGNPVQNLRWFQLGDDLWAGGARGVSLVVIKTTETTPVTLQEGTDYTLDAERGRFYLTSASSNNKGLVADFTTTKPAHKAMSVSSSTMLRVRGGMRFLSNNLVGRQRDWYFPDVLLSPNGPYALKSRENVQRLGFTGRIQQPEDGSPAIICSYGW